MEQFYSFLESLLPYFIFALQFLSLMLMSTNAQFQVLVLMHKPLYGLGPKYLSISSPQMRNCPALRFSGKSLSMFHHKVVRYYPPSMVAAWLWNSFPVEVHQEPSLYIFRKMLKTQLFRRLVRFLYCLMVFEFFF